MLTSVPLDVKVRPVCQKCNRVVRPGDMPAARGVWILGTKVERLRNDVGIERSTSKS